MSPTDSVSYRLQRRVAAYVRDRGALLRGERALLLLSGGADSMALLDLIQGVDDVLRLNLDLAALHVDYATRGDDSTRDRRIVSDACEAAGVRLHVVCLEDKLRGGGFQARARALRYDRARELAVTEGYDVIVTAHNCDDQAETVIYRLAKYASPLGLAGMRTRDAGVARPLLCVGAAEIRTYCRTRGIAFGEDVTNLQRTYARNRIRLDVLPILAGINPRAVETIAAGAELAAEEAEVLAAAARAALDRVLLLPLRGDIAGVDTERLALESPALQSLALHELVRSTLGGDALVERRVVQAMLVLARRGDGSGKVTLRDGLEAVRSSGRLRLRLRERAHGCPPAGIALSEVAAAQGEGAVVAWRSRRYRLRLEPGAAFVRDQAQAFIAVPDGARRVTLRHPLRGERFAPLGLGAATTVARFLAAAGVPREARDLALVVAVDDVIAWVGCVIADGSRRGRVAESFRVHESTSSTLRVVEEDM
jgi:tRNA(Ile)-lysidine synthase